MTTMTSPRQATGRMVAIAAVALAAALPAAAMPGRHGAMLEGGGMPMAMGHPERMDRMIEGAGASAEQRSQVRAILDAARKDLQARREAGQALREQGRQIFTAPAVDARAAEAWRQQVQAQRDEASKRMLQAMLEVSRVLTPEQRAKIAERMGRRHAMMEQRRGAEGQPAR
jgi:Spy/CpxP family protein refolding chaperone